MQIVDKALEQINQIFEILNVVYDPTAVSFNPSDTIITKFNEA